MPFNTYYESKVGLVTGLATHYAQDERREFLFIPDNTGELIIPLTKGVRLKLIGNAKAQLLDCESGYLLKPRRRGMELICEAGSKFLLIKINPVVVKEFCNGLEEVSNGIHSVNFDPSVLSILAQSKDVHEVEEILVDSLKYSTEAEFANDTVTESIEKIRSTSGTITIKEIYSSLNVSKSKLEQHFNREIGLTPKEFCKIEKINFFINSYKSDMSQKLTELTYKCGYYDQSHLIKDFRYFLDLSPKRYFDTQQQLMV